MCCSDTVQRACTIPYSSLRQTRNELTTTSKKSKKGSELFIGTCQVITPVRHQSPGQFGHSYCTFATLAFEEVAPFALSYKQLQLQSLGPVWMKINAPSWQISLWMLVRLLGVRQSFPFSPVVTKLVSQQPRSFCRHPHLWRNSRILSSSKPVMYSITTHVENVAPAFVKIAAEDTSTQSQDAESCHAARPNETRTSTSLNSARVVTDLAACGERLRAGDLVAFPTETVYGLGCHALDESAVLKVFHAKERPLSDPLIVHVLTVEEAFALWQVSPESLPGQVLQTLCHSFWPGPLTLVAPAASHVPSCVTAGTHYVACRSPLHPIAQELLRHARVPLGAPSANKFGHVSPTTAQHVWDDLQSEDVWIVDDGATPPTHGNNTETTSLRGEGGCHVGVESTVAKLTFRNVESNTSIQLQVLRHGKVSAQDLDICLRQARLPVKVESIQRATAEDAVNVAPGQTIRHYSPHIPSYLISSACSSSLSLSTSSLADRLRSSVVIDYGRRLLSWKDHAYAYRDLSPSGDSAPAARTIFETLRWAEEQPVSRILFPELDVAEFAPDDALLLAVKDRLTRAASGVVLKGLEELPIKSI